MTLHIIPQNDTEEHEASCYCTCQPSACEEVESDRAIWVHDAWDEREYRERVTKAGEPGKAWEVVRE